MALFLKFCLYFTNQFLSWTFNKAVNNKECYRNGYAYTNTI